MIQRFFTALSGLVFSNGFKSPTNTSELQALIRGFYKRDIASRLKIVSAISKVPYKTLRKLLKNSLPISKASHLIENVIGIFPMPLGLAVGVWVNGKFYTVPMAVEETSIVAGISHAAKLAQAGGTIQAIAGDNEMIAQIILTGVMNPEILQQLIQSYKTQLLSRANAGHNSLLKYGGGARDLICREVVHTNGQRFFIIHLVVDVADAMGANIVNTMAETIASDIKMIIWESSRNNGGQLNVGNPILSKIVSNYADRSIVKAKVRIPVHVLATKGVSGSEVASRIMLMSFLAEADAHRKATHIKGIINGIDPILIATGNDWRASDAGIFTFASLSDTYPAITKWYLDESGTYLIGKIAFPYQLGTVGGITAIHPTVVICKKILGVKSAKELAEVCAAVGLLQNLAALRALVSEGIQAGHMRLHASNLALSVGATENELPVLMNMLAEQDRLSESSADLLLNQIRENR